MVLPSRATRSVTRLRHSQIELPRRWCCRPPLPPPRQCVSHATTRSASSSPSTSKVERGKGNVDVRLAERRWRWRWHLCFGALIGAYLANVLHPDLLRKVFGVQL